MENLPEFKEAWKAAKTIELKFHKVGKFYPVTREQLIKMYVEGRMSEQRAKNFFTKESLEAIKPEPKEIPEVTGDVKDENAGSDNSAESDTVKKKKTVTKK